MITAPTFLPVHKTAQLGFISETCLRNMVKDGRCPGVYSGRKFLVNVDALIEQIDRESRANVKNKKG